MKSHIAPLLSIGASFVATPMAHAVWTQANFDVERIYTNTANWAGGIIDDTFLHETNGGVNMNSADRKIYFNADYTTGSNANGVSGRGLNLRYGGGGYLRLQGNGGGTGSHTLTLGGNVHFDPDTTTTGYIGSTEANSALNVNLGGAVRTFSGGAANDSLQIVNVVSNGGIASTSMTLQLAGANTYAGGTTVSSGTMQTMATGNFGTGNVTVANLTTAFLTLGNAQSIADTATLFFGNNSTINLNGGTETIAALTNTTQSKSLTSGLWTVTALNAEFGGDVFAGSGSILISPIPEPSVSLSALLGLGALTLVRRRR